MSGHSKWHQIKHKKSAEDVKRGKIFSRHSRLITIAARGGSDAGMNPALRVAIENARAENMPRENIERAIKKGTGEDKSATQMEEVLYEGFGPGGVAIYIETLTDNKNRTLTNIKNIMGKHGGNFGAAGSVGYLFNKKGIITVLLDDKTAEEVELAAIDAGADDINHIEGIVELYTAPAELMKVKVQLEKAGFMLKTSSIIYMPQTAIRIDDKAVAQKLLDLIEALEDDEDVSTVYHNAVIYSSNL